MGEYRAFDMEEYAERIRVMPCFICEILAGRDESHFVIYRDEVAIAFLSKYPTLYGYVLVAPAEHREQVTGDFSVEEYLGLQRVIYRVGVAIRAVVPTERLYILSLGSQQGNRHVHWHVAALPPGVAYAEQQLEALRIKPQGYLYLSDAEMQELVERLRAQLGYEG